MRKPEAILDPNYWKYRLDWAETIGQLHQSIFKCGLERWQKIEAKHREILARVIGSTESVLDAGCGYGRLLDLMPKEWLHYWKDEGTGAVKIFYEGKIAWTGYLGVDISPDFIKKAEELHSEWRFHVGDLRNLSKIMQGFGWNPEIHDRWNWAVLISVRPMIKRNLASSVWDKVETQVRKVAKKILYLEYDPEDEGSVE